MALGFFSFSACDAIAKLLTETFHPFQIVWLRMLGLFIGVCILISIRGLSVLRTPKPKLQLALEIDIGLSKINHRKLAQIIKLKPARRAEYRQSAICRVIDGQDDCPVYGGKLFRSPSLNIAL